ncbi:MAG TPA: hypothetical protein VFQ91_24775, partial [Bryobacteraceae bacterium]|nr:hypothetical protein [Bryobacteraceae bacterium]
MKCLQCGTELDRLSKWRRSSGYCSEECRKKSEEEFNRLAMSRLMQPRPLRTSARAAAAAIRTVESGAGRLTMVTHPPGASSPIVIEPPEAGFLMEASATLAELSLRYQPPAQPNLGPLCIPTVSLPWSSSLAALEEMVRGLRPARRGARPLAGLFSSPDPRAGRYAVPPGAPPENRLPAAAPVWPPSLGIVFAVAGLEELPAAPSRSGASAMGV